jgi:hypothetical protein
MAPVFSRAAWKCVWHLIQVQVLRILPDNPLYHLIYSRCGCNVVTLNSTSDFNVLILQNDLIHGWGLDMKLGYCAQVLNIVQIPWGFLQINSLHFCCISSTSCGMLTLLFADIPK